MNTTSELGKVLKTKGYEFSHELAVIGGKVFVYNHVNDNARLEIWEHYNKEPYVTDNFGNVVNIEKLPNMGGDSAGSGGNYEKRLGSRW